MNEGFFRHDWEPTRPWPRPGSFRINFKDGHGMLRWDHIAAPIAALMVNQKY